MSSSFVERVSFRAGVLEFEVTDGSVTLGTVRFEFVRSFVFLKESDFWREFERYEKVQLFETYEGAPRVSRIEQGALLEGVLGGRLDDEKPSIFQLWTPDECFEVVAFAEPEWLPFKRA